MSGVGGMGAGAEGGANDDRPQGPLPVYTSEQLKEMLERVNDYERRKAELPVGERVPVNAETGYRATVPWNAASGHTMDDAFMRLDHMRTILSAQHLERKAGQPWELRKTRDDFLRGYKAEIGRMWNGIDHRRPDAKSLQKKLNDVRKMTGPERRIVLDGAGGRRTE
ncbi:MAG TPA: hypothetical protein VLG09_05460 [Candidatus Saccharimonadales bacterium]|nr:hypothetical protein [Candidatus Saccharimonadales bacterium]